MLEVIDADLGSFTIANRAQVTGYFQSALVRLFHRGAQLVARDVHIRFERGRALISPEVDHAPSVVWPRELMHYRSERAYSFEIWCSDMHLRPNDPAAVNQ